ncbi:LIM domain protein [Hirschfeldia incana]|nr:LIM domain protein [Hirschfeldia incana]
MAADLLYAKTQRIVLLIDLNPLLLTPDSSQYLAVVFSAAEKLLSFPPLSTSLFSFKFFISSLSSLLSSSKLSALSIPSSKLSFDLPTPTLASLRRAIDVVKRCELRSNSTAAAASPRGVNVAASLRQIVYDYAWEPVVRGTIPGFTDGDGGVDVVRSNLVAMFSPISRDLKWVSEFLDVKSGDECLRELYLFKSKFGEVFDCVNDLFDDRDIHLSWVDVSYGERSELGLESEFFGSGVRGLGWGHCSTESFVYGSLIVPFGLIYPTLGVSPKLSTSHKFTVQACLEIADVDGKPMECKCGELEFSSTGMFSGKRCDEFINLGSASEEPCLESLMEEFCSGVTKLSIKALRLCDDLVELERYTCDTFVVHEVSQESDQEQEQESGFWADRVLQILEKETGEKVAKRSSPIWQVLLSYLYREGYSALVSLTKIDGSSRTGILKPFTFSSALISVFDSEVSPQTVDHEDISKNVSCSENKRKPSKKLLNSLHDMCWEEFCRSVKGYSQIDIEDAYFSKFSNSKKYKFLKCWMKQIRKPRGCSLSVASNCDAQEDVQAEPDDKNHNSSEGTEKTTSLPVSEEDIALSGNRLSVRQENDTSVIASESSENFFASLPSKIKQGIDCEEIDLAALAERLVKSCLLHSSQRLEKDFSCESGTLLSVTKELTKMLLKEPKDLVAKFKKKNSSSTESEQKPGETSPSSIIREYELQILFRMEILRSEIGLGSEESVTQKFAKQICMLLEAIQCKLDGGFFSDWSLDKYVDKIIKARYHHILGEAVSIIYTEMDLLMFSDEDLEDSFMNNEDSSQSGRDNNRSNIKSHHHGQRRKDVPGSSKKNYVKKETRECREARKVVEAQERRERARRFSSFTSWMPDLCRVWAPKQAKNTREKADQQKRMAKRKKEERSVEYDRVCETPVTTTDNKRTRTGDKDKHECGSLPRSSVPKALFQDDS